MQLSLCSIALLISSTFAATSHTPDSKLILSIPPSLPVTGIPSSSQAILSTRNLTISAPFTRAGTFEFPLSRLPLDSYLCDVYIRDYTIAGMKVVVSLASAIKDGVKTEKKVVEVYTTFRGREWAGQGELLGGSSLALELREDVRVDLRVVGMRSFYEERVDFSPLSLLKNPMILIGIAGLAMVIGMPKLLANMDPEMREEFEKAQKSSPLAGIASGGVSGGGFDVAGFLAGSKSGGENDREPEPETGKGKGGRRRG